MTTLEHITNVRTGTVKFPSPSGGWESRRIQGVDIIGEAERAMRDAGVSNDIVDDLQYCAQDRLSGALHSVAHWWTAMLYKDQ